MLILLRTGQPWQHNLYKFEGAHLVVHLLAVNHCISILLFVLPFWLLLWSAKLDSIKTRVMFLDQLHLLQNDLPSYEITGEQHHAWSRCKFLLSFTALPYPSGPSESRWHPQVVISLLHTSSLYPQAGGLRHVSSQTNMYTNSLSNGMVLNVCSHRKCNTGSTICN